MKGTVKENILFGRDFDENRYNEIVDACELLHDIRHFSGRDERMVEENGANLSGGQKQRLAIARAAYGDADIYLFDDPFSSLDPDVANEIFEKLISNSGLLGNKARVLITHSMNFLTSCDQVVFVCNGKIRCQGKIV